MLGSNLHWDLVSLKRVVRRIQGQNQIVSSSLSKSTLYSIIFARNETHDLTGNGQEGDQILGGRLVFSILSPVYCKN